MNLRVEAESLLEGRPLLGQVVDRDGLRLADFRAGHLGARRSLDCAYDPIANRLHTRRLPALRQFELAVNIGLSDRLEQWPRRGLWFCHRRRFRELPATGNYDSPLPSQPLGHRAYIGLTDAEVCGRQGNFERFAVVCDL